MYLNLAGVAILLIYSIAQRRRLRALQLELDDKLWTPSDFALMAHGIPKTMKEEELKQQIEEEFSKGDISVKILYINYCYDIRKMIIWQQ
mmetsp:Transcript_22773/g.21978  ORF Transcript_22773/g.21978 Transcript_22773/m.21978 type:complete len:90 (-) Transcript_22773:1926-2195(-)